MKRNECLDAALNELGAAGIRDVEKSFGGKHLQIGLERQRPRHAHVFDVADAERLAGAASGQIEIFARCCARMAS